MNASQIRLWLEYERAEVAASRLEHCIGDVYQQILHWRNPRHGASRIADGSNADSHPTAGSRIARSRLDSSGSRPIGSRPRAGSHPTTGSRLPGSRLNSSRTAGSRPAGSRPIAGSRLNGSRVAGSRRPGSRLAGFRTHPIPSEEIRETIERFVYPNS
jgi:hypothetical protein